MKWFYEKNGQQHGPVEETALQSMWQRGELMSSDLVWCEGMTDWQPYSSLVSQQGSPLSMGPSSYASQMQMPVPNSGLAMASMICGISSVAGMFCFVIGLAAIPAIICGHMALSQIKKSEVPIAGKGMAIAGLITGYLALAFFLVAMIVYGIFVAKASQAV